ncbi:YbaB/EbfC family nucleoid-associated protein [Micromonospora haikouensis]|uniref:YbaB/EbfC family nucleoid-associated protein n=1 Tax=Micromonospora haikouensis TaxID=686309 RepID=UPI0033C4AB21
MVSTSGGYGGGGAVENMLRQAQEQQLRLAELQRRRAELRVPGESPDGLVRVTVDGEMKIGDIEINARAMRLDSFSLAESLQAAIDAAYAAYGEHQQELLTEMLGGSELVRKAQDGTLTPQDWFRRFGVDLDDPFRGLRR